MSIFRKWTSFILFVVFVVAFAGCLSEGGNSKVFKKVKPPEVITTDPVIDTKEEETEKQEAYNPNGNKKPMITKFITNDLDEAIAYPGQVITFEAEAIDPEGSNVTIKFSVVERDGDKELKNGKWTVPNYGGIFYVKAVANDGFLLSEPALIEIKVPGKVGGIQVETVGVRSVIPKAPSRAISSTDKTIAKVLLETSEVVEITLSYITPTSNISVAPFVSAGTIVLKTWDTDATGGYDHVYTYTAPSSVASAAAASVTVTFDIVNPADITDYGQVSLTLIINATPTISSVVFTGTKPSSIEPGASQTIKVTATDTSGDTLTYRYEAYEDGDTIGAGLPSEPSNSTGEVTYTAGSSAGTEKVLVIVQDQRGAMSQSVFSFTVASPMYAVIADDNIASYALATTDNTTAISTADVSTVDNGSSVEITAPWNTADATSVEATFDDGVELFISNSPSGTVTYAWTASSGANALLPAAVYSNVTIANPDVYTLYPGLLSFAVTATDSVDTNVTATATESIYVNETPYVANISYTDADGNTVSLWDGTSQPTSNPQISPGQTITISTSVLDADNTRVAPANDAIGYFSDTTAKFLAKIIDNNGTSFVDVETNSDTQINTALGYTNGGTIASTLDETISTFTYEISTEASVTSALAPKKLVIRVADGYDNVADGVAPAVITTDYFVTVVGPDAAGVGIAKAPAATNTFATITAAYGVGLAMTVDYKGIKIGYDMTETHHNGEFYLAKTSTADTWKVYDVTAGAYIQDSNGAVITIDDSDVLNEGTLAVEDALPAPYDWLLIDMGLDIHDGDGASTGSNAYGYTAATLTTAEVFDKVYFKTYADQIVIPLDIVVGPKITAVSYNKYVTLGETVPIVVIADNDGDAATLSISQASNADGGVFAADTEGDSDEVTGEYWTYTAPTSLLTSTVTFTVTVTDSTDTTKKISKDVTFYLNRKPVIGDVVATDNVDATDGNWIKYGTHNISLAASVSDSDTGDTFGYIWSLPNTSNGTLNFTGTASSIWDPYTGATALSALGGPSLNGQYPIQVTVYDKDSAGSTKGGIATKTIVVGVNENPEIGSGSTDGLQFTRKNVDETDGSYNTATYYSSTNGALWFDRDSSIAATAEVFDDDDVATGSGNGTTTIDFSGVSADLVDGANTTVTPGLGGKITDGNTVNQDWTTVLQVGDKILVTSTEEPENSGIYTVTTLVADSITVGAAENIPTDDDGADTSMTIFRLEAQYPGLKIAVEPQGVNDESDDRDSLNYAFYVTSNNENGSPVTTEQFTYTSETDDKTGLSIKGLTWDISEALRGNGGTSYLHYRVSDDKNGVAKGVTDYTEKVVVTGDGTGPYINDQSDITIKVNGTTVTAGDFSQIDAAVGGPTATVATYTISDATGWSTVPTAGDIIYLHADAGATTQFYTVVSADANDIIVNEDLGGNMAANGLNVVALLDGSFTLKAGDEVYIRVNRSWANSADMGSLTVNAAALYGDAATPKVIDLEFNAGTSSTDPSDDYWEKTIVIPDSTASEATAKDAAISTAVGIPNDLLSLTPTDIFGNAGTAIARLLDQLDGGQAAEALSLDAIAYDTGFSLDNVKLGVAATALQVTNFEANVANEDIHSGGGTNAGGTDIGTLADYNRVIDLGDEPVWKIAITDATGNDELFTSDPTGKIDLTFLTGAPTSAETNWSTLYDTNNAAENGYVFVQSGQAGNALEIGDLNGGGTIALTEQVATSSDWVTSGAYSKTVDFYVQDNAGNKTYGNQDLFNIATTTAILNDLDNDIGVTAAGVVTDADLDNLLDSVGLSVGDTILIGGNHYLVTAIAAGSLNVINLDGAVAVAAAEGDIFLASDFLMGYDLTRPEVTNVEIYSYLSTATEGQVGYAPIMDRKTSTNTITMLTPLVAAADYSLIPFGTAITLTAAAGAFENISIGDYLWLDDNFAAGEMLVQATTAGTAVATSLSVTIAQNLGTDLSGNTNLVLYYSDELNFKGIDYTQIGEDSVANAKNTLDDGLLTTAEIVKITFSEPLYVGDDLIYGANAGGPLHDGDGSVGSTVNDGSINVFMYKTDGINTDNISDGFAAATLTADAQELVNLPNFAYRETGKSVSSTSVVYILLQSDALVTNGTVTLDGDITDGLYEDDNITDGNNGTLTYAAGTFVADGVRAGDIIRLNNGTPGTYIEVLSVDSDTQLTVRNNSGAIIISSDFNDADEDIIISARHIPQGKHFKVMFDSEVGADYTRISDQHGNAMESSSNNYEPGNNPLSW